MKRSVEIRREEKREEERWREVDRLLKRIEERRRGVKREEEDKKIGEERRREEREEERRKVSRAQTCKYAARRPDINGSRVDFGSHQHIGRPVPQGHHFGAVTPHRNAKRSSQTEIGEF